MIVKAPKYLLNFFGLTPMIVRIVLSRPRKSYVQIKSCLIWRTCIEFRAFYSGPLLKILRSIGNSSLLLLWRKRMSEKTIFNKIRSFFNRIRSGNGTGEIASLRNELEILKRELETLRIVNSRAAVHGNEFDFNALRCGVG